MCVCGSPFGGLSLTSSSLSLSPSLTDRIHWQLGSLSHAVNSETTGYVPLPDFPAEAPDPTVRNVEDEGWWNRTKEDSKKKNFYESGLSVHCPFVELMFLRCIH